MKANLIFCLITNLIFYFHSSFSQTIPSGSSETKAFRCARNYIEAFNDKNTKQLEKFFITYYENPDLERKFEIERSLQKSWEKLETKQVSYDSENEIILLMQAQKMPKSYLLFDIKLSEKTYDKIEYFTRTGIPKPKGRTSLLTNEEVMYFSDRAVRINDSIIQQTVIEIAKAYDTYYFISETGKSISTMLIDNLKSGKYSQITKAGRLADSIKTDILELHFDHHSWVQADRRMLPYDSIAGFSQNFGFEKVKILDGNIGYIKLNEFSPLQEAQVVAGHALDSVSNCNTLILDLRNNHGGYPQMIRFLSSYFFPVPTKVNTLYDRNGNIVDEIWTLDSIPGKRFHDSIPVIILTSNQTASAAEGFVNFFKENNRAIIIGDTTNGARHPAKEIVINSLFMVSIPYLRGEEKGVIEGEGIIPDIHVSADMALEKAIEYASKNSND
jgi:hypothetical protein